MKRSYVVLVLVLIALGLSAQIVPQVKNGDSKESFWRLRSDIRSYSSSSDPGPDFSYGNRTYYYYSSNRPGDVDSMNVVDWNEYLGDVIEHEWSVNVNVESLPESYDVIEHWYRNENGILILDKTIRSNYSLDNRIIIKSEYNEYGILVQTISYEYDENGNVTAELTHNRDFGQWHLDHSIETVYNQANLPISILRKKTLDNSLVPQLYKSDEFYYGSYSTPDSISTWEDYSYTSYTITTTQTNYFDNDGNCLQNHYAKTKVYDTSGNTYTEDRNTFKGYILSPDGFLPLWETSYGIFYSNGVYSYSDSTNGVYSYSDEFHTHYYSWTSGDYSGMNRTRTYNENWLLTQEWSYSATSSGGNGHNFRWDWEYVNSNGADTPPTPEGDCIKIAPNPFTHSTGITYTAAASSEVKIDVYNLRGQKVSSVANGVALPGVNQISWKAMDDTGKALPSGIYILRISTPRGSAVAKMVLAK